MKLVSMAKQHKQTECEPP